MNDKNYEKEVVFDRDPLTFYDVAEHTGSWVGLDFGEPIEIDKSVTLREEMATMLLQAIFTKSCIGITVGFL